MSKETKQISAKMKKEEEIEIIKNNNKLML